MYGSHQKWWLTAHVHLNMHCEVPTPQRRIKEIWLQQVMESHDSQQLEKIKQNLKPSSRNT